ncbi:hypothetical protein WDU94_013039 [Cyamophila willieti]
METQENSQPTSPIHDEITVETSDSDPEVEQQVKYENEKNSNLMKAYANSPKLNVSSNNINRNNASLVTVHQPTPPRPKPTEWQIVTHVKLTHDVDIPKLPIHFKETSENRNVFFCLSKSEHERKQAFNRMFEVYNAWRKQYNEVRGFNSVDEDFDRTDNHDVSKPREEEQNVDAEENDEEKPREKTPDITNDDDFPTLGGGRPSTSRNNVSLNKSSSSLKQVDNVINVDIEEFEEKDDPDDQDFIPATQRRNKKNNKKTVYKKPSGNIFDFDDTATAWQSSKEVAAASTGADPKNKVVQEPILVEEKIPCPICNKQFPLSQIETHASDCLSFEDAVPLSSRTRSQPQIVNRTRSPPVSNIEADDAILVSDDEDEDRRTKTNSEDTPSDTVKTEQPFTPKSKTKRLLSDPDSSTSSPTKKFCQS